MANGKGNTLGAGRPKGVANKSTTEVREAIAAFASANVSKMGEWLNAIDNPEKKLDLYLKAIEYHIPKLARTEHAGDEKNPIKHDVTLNLPPEESYKRLLSE